MCKVGFSTASINKGYVVCPEKLELFSEALKYQNASESPFKSFNVKRCMKKLSEEDLESIRVLARSLLR